MWIKFDNINEKKLKISFFNAFIKKTMKIKKIKN